MIFIIAHRMRTVDGVDKIVVLKDGVVAEQGDIYIYLLRRALSFVFPLLYVSVDLNGISCSLG